MAGTAIAEAFACSAGKWETESVVDSTVVEAFGCSVAGLGTGSAIEIASVVEAVLER